MKTPSHISVLVTGASTGIGQAIALHLAREGHQVFATVRSETHFTSLSESAQSLRSLVPVRMDVTDSASIASALDTISSRRDPLLPFSLVNNAGIAVAGPMESLPMQDLRRQFDVNFFGLVEVTQAFLPLIHEKRGRIVNMSSVSGLFASPFLGAYSASKFALEAFSDSLRLELAYDGVKVLLIEPGPIQTPIWDKGVDAEMPHSPRYKNAVQAFEYHIKKSVAKALPPARVVDAVNTALFSDDPPVRQIVTSATSRLEFTLAKLLPSKWVERAIVKELFQNSSR